MAFRTHERCKFCGDPSLELLTALPEAAIEVVRCRLCRMPFVSVRYDDAEAAVIYDQIHSDIGQYQEFEPKRSPRFQRLLAAASGGRSLDGARVLDIGAGGGGFLALARERGARPDGIEPSTAARRYAAEHYGIELSAAPIDDPSWASERFDVITIWDLIEHLPDPAATLEHATRLLAPGGRIALTTPARAGALHRLALGLARASGGRLSVAARHRYNYLHLQIFRGPDLAHLLEVHDVAVERCARVADFSFPGSWYLRTARIPSAARRWLGPLADLWLERWPPRNKLLVVGERRSAAAPARGSARGATRTG